MKIFGYNFFEKSPPVKRITDITPEVTIATPSVSITPKPADIPRLISPVYGYTSTRLVGRGAFQPGEYNLAEVGRIEDVESMVRQSFDKKVALMFKEGWDLVGKNLRTVKYVKARLAQISQASAMPTEELFRNIGSNLVRKSNSFLLKVRKIEASGGKERQVPGTTKTLLPVAAYFPIPAETMEFSMDKNKIVKWQQRMPDGEYQEFRPEDVVHMYVNRKDGFVFGTPSLVPVIDDIRALRKIEENIELLVYQHLFPLFQYRVGTETRPAGITETGEREVDVVRQEIQYMPSEGGIVTTERHEIKAIGAEGRAIRAEGYLEHFKKRVIAGLGISAVDLGDGETMNRSTADNMSRNLVDGVKDFQDIAEVFINEFLINELLLESNFSEDVLAEENRVYLKFKEVDLDAQIKKNNHSADLFNKDVINLDEARIKIGLDPYQIPTPEEIESEEDLSAKYPGWYHTRWKLFEEPKLLIQSSDEPYSAAAKALAANPSSDISQKGLDEEAAGDEEKLQTETDTKITLEKEKTKAKIAVAKARPKPKPTVKRKDAFLHNVYLETRQDIVTRIELGESLDDGWLNQLIISSLQTTVDKVIAHQMYAFQNGFQTYNNQDPNLIAQAAKARVLFRERAEKFVKKLTNDLVGSMRKNISTEDSRHDAMNKTRIIFDTLEHRAIYIEDVEIKKAYNYGILLALKTKQTKSLIFKQVTDGGCDLCDNMHSHGPHSIPHLVLDDMPPFHPNCSCYVELVQDIFEDSVKDRLVDVPEDPTEGLIPDNGQLAKCPECDKTAIRVKDTPNTYKCRACGYAWNKEENNA